MSSYVEGERTGDDRAWPCLHELVEQHTRRIPDAVAVRCGREKVTYGQLAEWSDRIARTLVHRGVVPGDPVAVLLPNSASFAAAVLGVLRAGGVLFPLDTRLSAERVQVLLGETRPRVLISRPASAAVLPASGEIGSMNPDALPAPSADRCRFPRLDARSIAYLLYTSGTTGERKGVLNRHVGVSSHLAWLYAEMPLPEQSRILMRSPQIFDIWLLEFFWALGGGHQLVMAETERAADPTYLLQLLREEMIAGLNAVPSLLRRLAVRPEFRELGALRYVLSCGEPLDAALATAVLANPSTALYNLYGPTEASVIATHHRVDPGDVRDPVPIGRPLPRTSIHVLDAAQTPVPPGVCGELYIGGIAVGAGYLRPEPAGEERFIERIDGIGGRWFYRTGDLGLVRDDGDIVFLGRADGQVKVNGVRVETAELEAALRGHPSVLDCAVVVKPLGDDACRLLAYVVPRDRTVTEQDLAAYLHRQLPGAMVHPAAVLMLEELPVLPNGKRDHGALPVPDRLPRTLPERYQGPRTELERRLVAVWEEQLKVSPIGVHDDFYRLGGDPLLAFDTIATIAAEISPEIPSYDLTQLPTVAEIARLIEERNLSPLAPVAHP